MSRLRDVTSHSVVPFDAMESIHGLHGGAAAIRLARGHTVRARPWALEWDDVRELRRCSRIHGTLGFPTRGDLLGR